MIRFYYHEEPLSFIPALILRFPIGSVEHKLVIDSMDSWHKMRLCKLPSVYVFNLLT